MWWDFDTDNNTHKNCGQCDSELKEAVRGVHFKTIKKANRPLRKKDFKVCSDMSKKDINQLEGSIGGGIGVSHLSKVKKAFMDKAIREWG